MVSFVAFDGGHMYYHSEVCRKLEIDSWFFITYVHMYYRQMGSHVFGVPGRAWKGYIPRGSRVSLMTLGFRIIQIPYGRFWEVRGKCLWLSANGFGANTLMELIAIAAASTRRISRAAELQPTSRR